MNNTRNIRLTDDPLTNIERMIPMLNDEQRKAMSHVMFGCFIGEEIGKSEKVADSGKQLQEVQA